MNWTELTRCTHGMTFAEPCDYCEMAGLKESLKWMTRSVKRNERRLAELEEKLNPLKRKG